MEEMIQRLTARRDAVTTTQRTLLDAAEAEGRDLTPAEDTQFRAYQADVEKFG